MPSSFPRPARRCVPSWTGIRYHVDPDRSGDGAYRTRSDGARDASHGTGTDRDPSVTGPLDGAGLSRPASHRVRSPAVRSSQWRSPDSRYCPSYTETFMGHASGYIRLFFPLFLLGAMFGKMMEQSGAAGAIAETDRRGAGPRPRDPGGPPGLRRSDLWRGLALRGRFLRLSVRPGDLSRSRYPQAADPRCDRPGRVHAHDGRAAGLATDPEPDPHPLLSGPMPMPPHSSAWSAVWGS